MKDNNFYVIAGWMINQLKLKGTELNVFAIIYGFSQDGESGFSGSLQYLCDFCGVASKHTIIDALKSLVDKGYLEKTEQTINGVKFPRYKIAMVLQKLQWGSAEIAMGGSAKIAPNNIGYDKNSNNIVIPAYNPPKGDDGLFSRFWSAYPRKVSRVTAEKSFAKLKPTEELLCIMLAALEKAKKSKQWLKDNGQFIPHPATWLNQHRWEDELTEEKPKYSSFDIDDAFENSLKRTYG